MWVEKKYEKCTSVDETSFTQAVRMMDLLLQVYLVILRFCMLFLCVCVNVKNACETSGIL